MEGAVVKEIAGLVKQPVEIGDFIAKPEGWAIVDPASAIAPGPQAQALPLSTLGSVRDYVAANKDALKLDGIAAHVVSPSIVRLIGPLSDRSRTREVFVTAGAQDMTDGFLGKFMSLEDFILGLQIRFADADDRKKVLSLLSNVKNETVKSAMDDGMTQVVQAKSGVALVSEVSVPNPIMLCAYRTFRDIVQPSSLFVLRVQAGPQGGLPQVGLFEADGGAWKLQAIERIREWLVKSLPKSVGVFA